MKHSWQWKYVSTARTALRMTWLMDFLEIFMKNIYDVKTSSLSHCAKDAYNKGLGPHHPWSIR